MGEPNCPYLYLYLYLNLTFTSGPRFLNLLSLLLREPFIYFFFFFTYLRKGKVGGGRWEG